MKRNLFLSSLLASAFAVGNTLGSETVGAYTPHNGAVAVVGEDVSLDAPGNYADNVASGRGGAFAVMHGATLTLHAAAGENICMADNRDCAVPKPDGIGFNGVPNDVYIAAGGTLAIDTAADGTVVFNSGLAGASAAELHKQGTGTLVIGTGADASLFHGTTVIEEGLLSLQDGSVFGSADTMSSRLVICRGAAAEQVGDALLSVHCIDLQGGSITAEGRLMLMPGQQLSADGGTIRGGLGTYTGSTLTVNESGCRIEGDFYANGGSVVLNGGTLSVDGALIMPESATWSADRRAYAPGAVYTLVECKSPLPAGAVSISFGSGTRSIYRTEQLGNTLILTIEGSAPETLLWNGNSKAAWTRSNAANWVTADGGEKSAFFTDDTVMFTNGGSVRIAGTVEPGDIIVNNATALTFVSDTAKPAHIVGNGSLIKNGNGTLVLNNGNTYSGGSIINEGSIKTAGASSLGKGAVTLNGGILDLNGNAVANSITLNGTAAVKNGQAYTGSFTLNGTLLAGSKLNLIKTATANEGTLAGQLIGKGGLIVNGPITVSAANTYTGQTLVNAGGVLTMGTKGRIVGNIRLLGGTLRLDNPAGYTLGKGQTLRIDGGTVEGNLLIGPGAVLDFNSGTPGDRLTLTGGTLDLGGKGKIAVASTNGHLWFDGQEVCITTQGAVRSDAPALVSGGSLTFKNGNSYKAGTTVKAGSVTAGGVTAFGTGAITMQGGTLNLGKYAVTNPITVNGPANLKGTAYKGALTINDDLGTGTNFYLGKNATLNSGTVKGVLTGAAGVSVKGEGTLAGKNTYKGTTAVQAGGLLHLTGTVAGNIAVSGTLDSSSRTLTPASGKTLTVNNGGVVKGLVNVASGRTLVLKGTESSVGSINLNAGTAVFDSTAATQVFSGTGVFSFNGHRMALKTKSTVKSAAATPMTLESGSITLTSSKGYSGPITLNGGTLNLGKIALASPVTVDGTANLIGSAYKGALTVNGTLAGSTNIYLGKTATLNGGTVKGILKGKGGVVVRGESTLANKNTYTGTTNIQSGATLHLPGSVAGNIVVSSDATLDNTKAVSLTKGRTMKVMDGATVTGGITVGSGATLSVYGDESKLGSTTINGGTAVFDSTAASVVGTGTAALTVHGKKLTVKAKSTLKMAADEDLTLRSGKLVLNSTSTTYTGDLLAQGGTLDLASRAVKNDVYLGNAVLMNGNALRGTLHVQDANSRYSGSLTLTSARKLDFEAGSKLTVSGTLTLKGGTALTLSGDDWEEGQYTLMSCGKLSGKAATAFKVTGAEGFDAAIRSSGKNIILTLTAIPEAKQSPGLTTACATLADPELTMACETLAEPELTAAAEEVQPLALATEEEEETLTATAYEPDTYAAAMQELAPTAEALVQSDWALVDTTRAFTASIRNRSMGTLTQDGRGAIWANAIGSFARLGSVNGHSGSQTNVYGGSIGAEHVFGEHHTLGVALGSTHAMVGGTSLGKLRQNATHLALYGNSRMGSKFSADWAAAFGTATIHADMGANRGKWEQNSGELTARLTYTETLSDRTALRTYAGLDYDATGADRVNGYKTGSVQALRGELGIGLTQATENAVLYAEIGMVGDMVRHNPTVESAHFRLQGANPGRTGFKATLGGSMKLNEAWCANAAYNLETAKDNTVQSVNVGISRKF